MQPPEPIAINDVYITPEGVYYRFLRRNRDDAFIIELGRSAATLKCVDWSVLRSRLDSGLYKKRALQNLAIAHHEPSEADEAHRQRRKALIEPLLEMQGLYERRGRNQLIENYAREKKVSPQTIRTLLTMWFQGGQTPDSLLTNYKNSGKPKPPSEPQTEPKPSKKRKTVAADFVGPPSPFLPSRGASYNTSHRSRPLAVVGAKREQVRQKILELHDKGVARTKVYREVVSALYSDPMTGEWLPEWFVPSRKQVRDLRKEVLGVKDELIEKHGRASVANNQKPLTGSVLQHAIGAGFVYEVDSTIVDVWIVARHNRNKIIGKATLYLVVCRYSRAIVGFHLTLDKPSWAGAMEALVSVTQDKEELCAFWGAQFVASSWVKGNTICAYLVADRGAEWIGNDSDQIADGIKITFANMPAQMSVLKGMVECTFKLLHQPIRENVPGYELPQNIFARQKEKDYEVTACMTLDDLAVEVIDFIGIHNNFIYTEMELDPELVGTVPTPMNIWNADIYRQTGMHRAYDEIYMRQKLRPRKRVVVRREGILVNGCYYHCEEAYRHEWFERAATGRFRVVVSYERRLVDFIWIHNPEWGDEPVMATLAPRSAHFKGLSVREVMLCQYEAKMAIEGARYKNDKALSEYDKRAEARTAAAMAAMKADRAANPGQSRMSDRPEHRGAETDVRRSEEVYRHAQDKALPAEPKPAETVPPPSPSPSPSPAPAPTSRAPSPPSGNASSQSVALLTPEQLERIALGLDD